MANLFYGKINTNGKFVKLSEATGLTIQSGITYMMQPQGVIATYTSDGDIPEDGGFLVYNNPIMRFELNSNEELYIKTFNSNGVNVNIAT